MHNYSIFLFLILSASLSLAGSELGQLYRPEISLQSIKDSMVVRLTVEPNLNFVTY